MGSKCFWKKFNTVARISASAGSIGCPGHFLVFQFDWQWKMAHVPCAMPPKTIKKFNSSIILESQVLRTNQGQQFYDKTWEELRLRNQPIADYKMATGTRFKAYLAHLDQASKHKYIHTIRDGTSCKVYEVAVLSRTGSDRSDRWGSGISL